MIYAREAVFLHRMKERTGMKALPQWKEKLLFTIVYVSVLLVFRWFQVPCFWLSLFHLPCPGCGMSRAVIAAMQLDFGAAFRLHPMFWSVPILYLFYLYSGELFRNKMANRVTLTAIAIGFVIQWILKIVGFC